MASLGMMGPFEFTREKVDQLAENKPGNFALGKFDSETSKMVVMFVGRADVDLNAVVKAFLTNPRYKAFKCSQAEDAKAAYEKECRNWHDFGGAVKLDNKSHPSKPDGVDWKCPKCGD
jgi:hypothetical protein